jgi:putative endopeptidase
MKNKIIYALAISSAFVSCKQTKMNSGKTQALQSIDLKALDTTIQPADDFFLFANGTWIANTEIPASESRWGSFNELEQANNKKLVTLLKEAAENPGALGSQNQLLSAYFMSYTDMARRNELGLVPIQEDLTNISGIQKIDDLQGVVAKLHKDGVGAFFGFGVGQDLKNVANNVAY